MNYSAGATFSLTGEPPITQPAGGAYTAWDPLSSPLTPPNKTLSLPSLPNFTYIACLSDPPLTPTPYEHNMLTFDVESGHQYYWDVGFAPLGGWLQTTGGDVYAGSNITSYIPQAGVGSQDSPLRFSLDGSGGNPGVVVSGGSVDLTLDPSSNGIGVNGDTYLSSTRWVASTSFNDAEDYYQHMAIRLGNPTTGPANPNLNAMTLCASEMCFYTGNATVTGPIAIAANSNHIILIDGSLTIADRITVAPGGFIAFIVSGPISIDESVGNPKASGFITGDTDPSGPPNRVSVQGVYISGDSFTIQKASPGPDLQFIGKGMFIAKSFTMHRTLGVDNTVYPSHLFFYDPNLLMAMPQIMQDVPVSWEEVAP